MFAESKVKFPPVRVELFWPDRWCSYCMGEVVEIGHRIYECVSCNRLSCGRIEYVQATVRVYPTTPNA